MSWLSYVAFAGSLISLAGTLWLHHEGQKDRKRRREQDRELRFAAEDVSRYCTDILDALDPTERAAPKDGSPAERA